MRQGAGAASKQRAISMDVGGTFTKVALVDSGGNIVRRWQEPSEHDIASSEVPGFVVRLVRGVLKESSLTASELVGVCVGIPGVIDRRTQTIISCPNLTNWEGMALGQLVEQALGLPTCLEKDANEAALGERWLGAGRGVDDLVCFTLGTGIGTGIIVNGELYRGSTGGAGEIGHIIVDKDGPACSCGNPGCLESFASARAIVGFARDAIEKGSASVLLEVAGGDLDAITTETVFHAARSGDPVAMRITADAIEYLGVSIASVVNVFNPAMIILGGGMAQAGEQILVPVREIVRKRARRLLADHVEIVLARLGNDAGLIGGAYLVFRTQGVAVQE
jgi:glucokinase